MIRALVADDEPPARKKLRELLAKEGDVELAGEASDGVETVAAIRAASPDVVFLDVQMPRLDGFGVIREVGVDTMPLTVFVTAYDEHALRAFEVHALDYLLKPFAPSRLKRVLDRVRRHLGVASGDLAQRVDRLLAEMRPATPPLRQILVEIDEGRQTLLALEAIDLIRADGNYLSILSNGTTYRRRGTLSDLESRLDSARFLRLNRSEIVRLDVIREIQPWFHGDARVVLTDGAVLTWSRRYRARAEGLF